MTQEIFDAVMNAMAHRILELERTNNELKRKVDLLLDAVVVNRMCDLGVWDVNELGDFSKEK